MGSQPDQGAQSEPATSTIGRFIRFRDSVSQEVVDVQVVLDANHP
jgi:hypothetical protein